MKTPLQRVVERLRSRGLDTNEEQATKMLANMGKTTEEYLAVLDEAEEWSRNYKPGKPPKDGNADKFLEPITYTVEMGNAKEET